MDDVQMMVMLEARNEEAIVAVQEAYGDYCRGIAMRILHNSLDAEECINDAFWRAWKTIPPQKPQNLRAFVGKITRNLALDRYEKYHAQKRGAGQMPFLLDELVDCVPQNSLGNAQTDAIVIRDTISRFLDRLPPRERWLFLRRYWYGDDVVDLARAAGVSGNHVNVILHRTRMKLKKALEQEGIRL